MREIVDSIKLVAKTEHYNFLVDVLKREGSTTLIIGNESAPCLELYIVDEGGFNCETASLDKIDAMVECSRNSIDNDYLEKYSFGQEILHFVDFILSKKFPYVKHVRLHDASYMPCHRPTNERLDLLTYSIAIHKKTWYEMKLNAYLPIAKDMKKYREEVERYASKENKESWSFQRFFEFVINDAQNHYAIDFFLKNKTKIESIYANAETFPDLFKSLNTMIDRKDRCKMYKDWLEHFMEDEVHIKRSWKYDVQRKRGGRWRRSQTRKRRN